MQPSPGVLLAHYELVSPLGKGGMGEVWRASDRRLQREVAVKFLPQELSADPERLARFEREARVLAALDHPGIAAIHGVQETEGQPFLVMQLAEGEDLSTRVERGAIPLDEALEIASQIADALAAAHEKGIIHRDLKPANIKIGTDGRVRLLDFGLARAFDRDEPLDDVSHSPTMLRGTTGAGMILGTAGYMSPEQARGKRADRRADLWALGVVIWEMITGQRLFAGESVSDTLAAVLRSDPDWALLPRDTPPALRRLLRRCLERDPRKRLSDASAARLEIEEAAEELQRGAQPRERVPQRRVALAALAGALAVVLIGGAAAGWLLTRDGAAPAAPLRLEMSGVSFNGISAAGISPDGRRVAFVPYHPMASGALHVRSLDDFSPQVIPATEGAHNPFFSPDGTAIAYFTAQALHVVRPGGGIPQRVATVVSGGESGFWTEDGHIIFSGANVDGRRSPVLMRVPAAGGSVEPVTKLAPGDQQHRHPIVVGNWLIFSVVTSRGAELFAQSTTNGTRHRLADSGSTPQYIASTGHLLFFRLGQLTVDAAPFDHATGRFGREPVPVLPNVLRREQAGGAYAVSRNGTLIYTPSDTSANMTGAYSLVWVDRAGNAAPITSRRDAWTQPRLSPDGRTLLVRQTVSPDCTLWTIDLERGTISRLTFKDDHHAPRWHPAGDRIVSVVGYEGSRQIRETSVEPRGREKELVTMKGSAEAPHWSPDGRYLAFEVATGEEGVDIYIADTTSGTPPEPLVTSPFDESTPAFSPDGQWLAYTSNESGASEVYVMPFRRPGRRIQVSTSGGTGPLWSRDGRELLFASRDRMMVVGVTWEETLAVSAPRELFTGKFVWERNENYDISADGQRLIMIQRSDDDSLTEILRVAVGWGADVEKVSGRR